MNNFILICCILWTNSLFAQKNSNVPAAARRHIEAANKQYDTRFQTGDPAFFQQCYTADACIMPENMPMLCGREAIAGYYYHDGQNRNFRMKINVVELSGGADVVIEQGQYVLIDSSQTVLDQEKFIATWVREEKNWKLRREIWTTDMPPADETPTAAYDSILAQKLGADDYGMASYFLVLLKTGPAQITEKATVDSLFAGHMANMNRLAGEGKLVLAGPIGRKEKYRGMMVFNAQTREEVAAMAATDPAIRAGLLEPEIMPYYGSAALRMVNEWHAKVQKKGI